MTEANALGLSRLVRDAEAGHGRVLLRNNKPVAAVVGIDVLERAEELEDTLLDLSLAVTRLLTTGERRHSLDEVLDRFGFTREELLDEGSS